MIVDPKKAEAHIRADLDILRQQRDQLRKQRQQVDANINAVEEQIAKWEPLLANDPPRKTAKARKGK